MLNSQDTIELRYFQKLQVQKQEISALKRQVGELTSEVDHWKYMYEQEVARKVELVKPLESNKKLRKRLEAIQIEYARLLSKQLNNL